MAGNIVEVPKILLKKVAEVDPEFIKQNAHFVLEEKASLKVPLAHVIDISGFQSMELDLKLHKEVEARHQSGCRAVPSLLDIHQGPGEAAGGD